MGRLDRNRIEVEVTELEPFINEKFQGFKLIWVGNIGFGEYIIYTDGENWYADSECMDGNDDKWFIQKLMSSFIEKLKITS